MAAKIRPLVSESGRPVAEQALLLGAGLSNLEYAHCAEVILWPSGCSWGQAPEAVTSLSG